jgi:AraC-like DNA-binding protein
MPVFAASELPNWDFPRGTASVAKLVDFGRGLGLVVTDLLDGSGICQDAIGDPDATIEAKQELAVAANLVRLLGDPPGLGFEAGSHYHIGTFGIFGYACLTSPTLGEATRFALRYWELTFGFTLPTVTVDGDIATLRLELPEIAGPVAEFLIERDLTAMAMVMSELTGLPAPVDELALAFPGRGIREALGTAPRFDAQANTVTFPAEYLTRPLPQAHPITVAGCESQCQELVMRNRARTGVAHRVREQLVRITGAPHTIGSVALALAVSERTLRRRLTQENTSFRQLYEEVHRTLAQEMLATGALSVDDVAIRLGYAEASSFIAAFKRWTGTTPARYQRQHRGSSPFNRS